jgi:acyl-CoA ligase (AMP-forming) (exosortase A-associated)
MWNHKDMPELIHECISRNAKAAGERTALIHKKLHYSYADLQAQIALVSNGLLSAGIEAGQRVAIYLPKQPHTVFAIYGTSLAGASFVPINPLLKAAQVAYILAHCGVKVLITSTQRLNLLTDVLKDCPNLHTLVVCEDSVPQQVGKQRVLSWPEFADPQSGLPAHRRIDTDMAAILYTSGSTGSPKGVVLSHRNIVAGANSVASYLENTQSDTLLAVLPLSFDAGLSQLTTAFSVAASVVLMDYLLPRDVIRAVVHNAITGLAAVPVLWNQLAALEWPKEAVQSLRYITNTGGAMPVATTAAIQKCLPDTEVFLMYGLTEAFRSTFLSPEQITLRPNSIGKAIPNAEILVINEQGLECQPNEPGELVHRGSLVAMGYWNDVDKTNERFRPAPGQFSELPIAELAVWSGDRVRKDEEGYLYFVSRQDEMIKTSGYRVSPTEVEEVAYSSNLVSVAAALGLPHPSLGQAILLVVTAAEKDTDLNALIESLLVHCRCELPNYMVPLTIVHRDSLPCNQNGKIDRKLLSSEYQTLHQDASL